MAEEGPKLARIHGLNQRMKFQLSKLWIYIILGLFFFFIATQIVGFSSDLSDIFDALAEFVRLK